MRLRIAFGSVFLESLTNSDAEGVLIRVSFMLRRVLGIWWSRTKLHVQLTSLLQSCGSSNIPVSF